MHLTRQYKRVASPTVSRVFTQVAPPRVKGDPRFCFENARREFWAHEGEAPEYWVGWLTAHYEVPWLNEEKRQEKLDRLHHAWVVVNDIVYDSTPIKYGLGNFNDLPSELPYKLLDQQRYEGLYRVGSDRLNKPLKFFPPKD